MFIRAIAKQEWSAPYQSKLQQAVENVVRLWFGQACELKRLERPLVDDGQQIKLFLSDSQEALIGLSHSEAMIEQVIGGKVDEALLPPSLAEKVLVDIVHELANAVRTPLNLPAIEQHGGLLSVDASALSSAMTSTLAFDIATDNGRFALWLFPAGLLPEVKPSGTDLEETDKVALLSQEAVRLTVQLDDLRIPAKALLNMQAGDVFVTNQPLDNRFELSLHRRPITQVALATSAGKSVVVVK